MSDWRPDGALDAAAMRRVLHEVLARCATWHSPADARPRVAMCIPAEEQEYGREQVLDEVRAMLRTIEELVDP